ncbi:MAG: MFS transporter [Dehalococcoidia bacterium]
MSASATTADPAARRGRRPLIYYGYWLIGVAFVAQLISAGSQAYVAGIFVVPMSEDLGWTRAEFSLAQTAGRFIMAFFGIFVGVLVDRGYARGMMIAGITVLGAGLFLTSGVTELWQWILLRGLLFTVGAAMIGSLVVNVTLAKWFVQRRGLAVGMAAVGVSVAGIVMPLVLTPFVDEFGWRAGWRLLAVVSWAAVYPAALLMRSTPEEHGLNPDGKSDEEMRASSGDAARADFANSLTRGEALRTRTLYQIVLAFGVSGVGLGTILFTTIPFTTDAGFSRTTASFMLAFAVALPAALTKPVWGVLLDRYRPKVLAASGFLISGVGTALVVVAAQAQDVTLLAAGFVLIGIGFGGQIPIQEVIWASYFGRRYLGAVRSVAMPFTLFFGAGGPLVVQLYFDQVGNYDGAFYAVAALWVLAAVLVLLVRQPKLPARIAAGPRDGDGAAAAAGTAMAVAPEPAPESAAPTADAVAEPERGEPEVEARRPPPRDYMQPRS